MLKVIKELRTANRGLILENNDARQVKILSSFDEAMISLNDLEAIPNPTTKQQLRMKQLREHLKGRPEHRENARRAHEKLIAHRQR